MNVFLNKYQLRVETCKEVLILNARLRFDGHTVINQIAANMMSEFEVKRMLNVPLSSFNTVFYFSIFHDLRFFDFSVDI